MKTAQRLFSIFMLGTAALTLGGCVGLVVGTAATAGIAASQERGLGGAISDNAIALDINGRWLNQDSKLFVNVNTQVTEGRVLLTGHVEKPEHRLEAVRLAWQAAGVKEVINEIEVAKPADLGTYARDSWITAQLRTRLTFDREVDAINYSIETVAGTVYLMGIARTQAELDRAIGHARTLPYVERVVSHVVLKDDPRRKAAAGS